MHSIYYTDYNNVRENITLDELIKKLPSEMHKRANRYKFEADAFNFTLGRLLLKKGLKDLGTDSKVEEIRYFESGKPFLENVYFNISHTDGLVACAFSSDGEIGLDVEKVKQIKLTDFKAWFTEKEMSDILAASSPIERFYWYWTRKESIIKALGVNLSYLHAVEIDATKNVFIEKEKRWFLKDLDLPEGYIGSQCYEFEDEKLNLHQIPFRSL